VRERLDKWVVPQKLCSCCLVFALRLGLLAFHLELTPPRVPEFQEAAGAHFARVGVGHNLLSFALKRGLDKGSPVVPGKRSHHVHPAPAGDTRADRHAQKSPFGHDSLFLDFHAHLILEMAAGYGYLQLRLCPEPKVPLEHAHKVEQCQLRTEPESDFL